MSKVTAARERLIGLALNIAAGERAEPFADKEAGLEYLDEQLAHAARALTEATDELSDGEKPVGWIRQPYPLDLKHLDDKVSLRENVGRALGAASTCWESLKGTGVFDSNTAKEVYDELLSLIHRETVMLVFQKTQAEVTNGYQRQIVEATQGKLSRIGNIVKTGRTLGYSRAYLEDKVLAVVEETLLQGPNTVNGANN